MKTNRSVTPIVLFLSGVFYITSTHGLIIHENSGMVCNPDATRDYFNTPSPISSPVATISLRSYFDAAKEKAAPHEESFFSHAFSPFIQEQYNAVGYADLLSRDARHITEFLVLSGEYNFTAEQTYTGLRLFHNKLKEASLIDDTVVDHILAVLPVELERHFPLNPLNSAKIKSPAKMIENIMLSGLTTHLEAPKTSTENFFTGLSHTIAQSVKDIGVNDEAAMNERLRSLILKIVELLLSKTIWYAQHPHSIWPSVLKAAHNISQLCSNRIIAHLDDADEAYRTLVTRFVFFIEQSGHQLPVSWYENIESDLNNGLVPFLESPELDDGISSKKQLLLNALVHGKTCAIAQQTHGLLIE